MIVARTSRGSDSREAWGLKPHLFFKEGGSTAQSAILQPGRWPSEPPLPPTFHMLSLPLHESIIGILYFINQIVYHHISVVNPLTNMLEVIENFII